MVNHVSYPKDIRVDLCLYSPSPYSWHLDPSGTYTLYEAKAIVSGSEHRGSLPLNKEMLNDSILHIVGVSIHDQNKSCLFIWLQTIIIIRAVCRHFGNLGEGELNIM